MVANGNKALRLREEIKEYRTTKRAANAAAALGRDRPQAERARHNHQLPSVILSGQLIESSRAEP
jgi:hypothetical protein